MLGFGAISEFALGEFGVDDGFIHPSGGHLTLTGYAPSISLPQTLTPITGVLNLTGYAPTVSQGVAGTVAASIVVRGFGSAQILTEGFGASTASGTTLTPFPGHLSLFGYTPSVGQGSQITPDTGHITMRGYAPTVVGDPNARITYWTRIPAYTGGWA